VNRCRQSTFNTSGESSRTNFCSTKSSICILKCWRRQGANHFSTENLIWIFMPDCGFWRGSRAKCFLFFLLGTNWTNHTRAGFAQVWPRCAAGCRRSARPPGGLTRCASSSRALTLGPRPHLRAIQLAPEKRRPRTTRAASGGFTATAPNGHRARGSPGTVAVLGFRSDRPRGVRIVC